MPEKDELWKSDEHESVESTWERITDVLEEIWKTDDTCSPPLRSFFLSTLLLDAWLTRKTPFFQT